MHSTTGSGLSGRGSASDQAQHWNHVFDGHGDLDENGRLSGSDHPSNLQVETDALYDHDLIGVSISRQQTHMRSPDTPVAEKARALNVPIEYFQGTQPLNEQLSENIEHIEQLGIPPSVIKPPPRHVLRRKTVASNERPAEPALSRTPSFTEHPMRYYDQLDSPDLSFDRSYPSQIRPPDDSTQKPPSPWEYKFPPQKWRSENVLKREDSPQEQIEAPATIRQSLTRSFLSAAGGEGRRRSSSGPTAILSNLRKLLPDLPSASFNMSSMSLVLSATKTTGSDPNTSQNSPIEKSRFRWSLREPLEDDGSQQAPPFRRIGSDARFNQLDGNVESLLEPSRTSSLRSRPRSNSESSIYIQRRISGVSAYDDISAFANVAEMANSRFKAITDSFQNSTLRLPKMPLIRPSPKRRISPDKIQGQSQSQSQTGLQDSDNRNRHHQYTTLKDLRNSQKGMEVETSQQRAHPILSQALSKLTGDVVILGGYRGSILRSAQPPHRQLWVPIKVGLNLRKVDLEVGLTREDEEKMEQSIIPSGVLSHIGPIDICRRLLKHLNKCPNTRENKLRVHDWGYDWRLSPDLLSERLIKFLESLECNHPETPPEMRGATVVAHSLGGMITRHAVNQRPELFAGVIYAGTPQNCVNILGPLRNGDDVLLSSRVLTAQVTFTIRTSFALLPDDGRCFIHKHTNERYDLDFFDPHTWDEYRLSPCISPPLYAANKDIERRKSIIGALSDSINSSNKIGSWLGGQSSERSEPRQNVAAVAQAAEDRAHDARNGLEENAEEMVGPSMKQNQHRPNIATTVTIPKDVAREYLDRTLAEVQVFRQQLRFIPSHQENNLYPPLAYMFGKTVPTVYGARVASLEAIKYNDAFDDLAFAAGDGVVLASAAQLPEGYRCVKGGRVETDRGHVGLLGDLEGVGRCIEAVVNARSKGVGLGKQFARNDSY
ncbi:uncharacterized protein A1O9_07314 [Exophiala aquamarina CBS 119918]|uniref:Uncharacterized protein n=1 Tax=Exophiala aquamarina CBS 119918 TaxID=1182545 RepID=A0A072PAI3_9EURO|nr:uncharacterized protein A1O9_07314 [Exophiala aquamarina CBS 119918]KEF57124.1 hypothetical protein A1O9_07314 [Exophiala aquamarina CBS 119918]